MLYLSRSLPPDLQICTGSMEVDAARHEENAVPLTREEES